MRPNDVITKFLSEDAREDDLELISTLVKALRKKQSAVASPPIDQAAAAAKVVLQRDFLNVVVSPTGGYTEAEVTRDADGGMRLYSAAGGGGGGGDALVANPLSQFAATTSSQLRGVISDETGTGALVFATSPTLVTPLLGTPTSGVLTNCTGLPIAGGGTGQTTAYAANDALHVKGADIASAGTTNLATATGVFVHVTGTTTITAFGTAASGVVRVVRFAGALTLTHNATSLILPGGANITTAANDVAVMVSEGSGNWRCVAYQNAVYSDERSRKGLRIGTNVQAWSSDLDQIATAPASLSELTHDGANPYWVPRIPRSHSVTLVLSAGSTAWTNMPGAATLMYGNAATVRAVDLAAYTQCRLTVVQFNAAASPAHLRLRYSASAAGSAGSYSMISASECEVALGTAAGMHYLDSGWETLDAGAIGEVYIAVVGIDGDGAADPAFLAVTAEFR